MNRSGKEFIAPGLIAAWFGLLCCGNTLAGLPRPDHTVIVIFENRSYFDIIGNPVAPYLNALAAEAAVIGPDLTDPTGAKSGSHALNHPSQPNYLELFSGATQGVTGDGYPGSEEDPGAVLPPFDTPNLGAQLISRTFSFATYSEGLPAVGADVESASTDPGFNEYVRKHNPIANWQADDAPAGNHLPLSSNQPFFPIAGQSDTGFPSDFSKLPTVSFVVPNEQNDMHDGTVKQADDWLKKNILDTYYDWAKTHNSLLVITFDEDDRSANNLIPTIFAGPMIKPGYYSELEINVASPDFGRTGGTVTSTGTAMNHFNTLATVEDLYALPHLGGAVGRPGLSDIFVRPDTLILNASTRITVGEGDNVMIGGLIIGGSGTKQLLLRGLGPSLTASGTPLPGRLQDPVIELHQGDGRVLATNDDWRSGPVSDIQQTGIPPQDSRESAIIASLDPGNYTVILSDKTGSSGIGLVEIYDLETASSEFLNLSTRGNVQTEDNVMIAGVITGGGDRARILFRGIGPSLESNGIPLSNCLQDPMLELHDADGSQLAANDNWRDTEQIEIIQSGLAPADDREAAIVGDYPAGAYTVILRGKNNTTGVGLIEVYKLN